MTSEHECTPTEDEWRDATTYSLCDWWGWFETTDERDLAWARFIAQVKAEALREAADEYATSNRVQVHGVTSVLMFMHHRADQIEKGDDDDDLG